MIEVENLSKRYGEMLAVDGLDFVVPPGVVTGFLGQPGTSPPTSPAPARPPSPAGSPPSPPK
jgi:ABC-2 type transport system ATP-binding protein